MTWLQKPKANISPKDYCPIHLCGKVSEGICGLNWCIKKACAKQI
ncbi:MAG: hypothetical protein ACLUDJ_02330 [Lachnospiraceae bacterium]